MADSEQAAGPRSGRMNRTGYKLGEKMELRLLLMEERSRSAVMSHQIQLFQEKLERLRPEFDPYRMQVMLRELRMKTSLPDDHLYSVAKLRTVVLQKLYPDMFTLDTEADSSKSRQTVGSKYRENISSRYRQAVNSKYKQSVNSKNYQAATSTDRQTDICKDTQVTSSTTGQTVSCNEDQTATSKDKPLSTMARHYFKWLLRYFTFLQELHDHFTGRIYRCLCKYFYDGSLFRREISRISRHGSATSTSRVSVVSSPGADSGRSTARSETLQSMDEEETAALQRERSLTSLLSLSQRFTDIGNLYDTQQVDMYAGRLKNVMDNLRHLLNEDDPIDSSFFSSDSLEAVAGLKADVCTQDLIRLIPDVLVKLSKATWLAQQWVLQDEMRTKDAGERLRALLSLETQMEGRLQELGRQVLRLEEDLSRRNQELQQLLRKEERSTELVLKLQDLQDYLARLQHNARALAALKKELQERKKHLCSSPGVDPLELKEVQSRLKTVELQQFLVTRHLGTLSYQRQLTQADFSLELEVKPTIIHYTNSLQDSIERIEDELRERHTEMDNIKAALMPVQEDRKYLSEQIHNHDCLSNRTAAGMDLRWKREQPAGISHEERKRSQSPESEENEKFWESPIPMAWKTPDNPLPSPRFRRVSDTSQNSSETSEGKTSPHHSPSYGEEIEPIDDDFYRDALPHLKGLTPDPPTIDVLSFSSESDFSYSPPPVPSNSFKEQSSHKLQKLSREEKDEKEKGEKEKDKRDEKEKDEEDKKQKDEKAEKKEDEKEKDKKKEEEEEKEKEKEMKDKEKEKKSFFSPRDGARLFSAADFLPRPMITKAFPGRRDVNSGDPQEMSALQAAFSKLQSSESEDRSILMERMAPYMRNAGILRPEEEPTSSGYSYLPMTQTRVSRIPRYNYSLLEVNPSPLPELLDYASSPRPDGYPSDPAFYPDSFYGGRKKDMPEVETCIASTLSERKLPKWKAAATSASGWGYRPRQSDVLGTSSLRASRARALHISGHDVNPLNPGFRKKAMESQKEEQIAKPNSSPEAPANPPQLDDPGPSDQNDTIFDGPREAWQRESQTMHILSGPTPRILLSAASPVPSTSSGRSTHLGDPFHTFGFQPEGEYDCVPPVDIPQDGPGNRRL